MTKIYISILYTMQPFLVISSKKNSSLRKGLHLWHLTPNSKHDNGYAPTKVAVSNRIAKRGVAVMQEEYLGLTRTEGYYSKRLK